MAITTTQPRRIGRRRVTAASMLALALVVGACGSSEPSAENAREVLMKQLTDSGLSTETATCIVDESLRRFEPGELVNTSGQASDEVNAAVGEIVIECSTPETTIPATTIAPTTIPETTVPQTTVPETTVPETTVPELDLTAFCATSEDVYIALLAGESFETPAPATAEAYFAELIDRIELAIVTAPSSDFTVQPNELLAAIQGLDEVLAANGYDRTLVPEEEIADEGDVVNSVKADLEFFLEDCDTGTDVDAEASALAEQLISLGGGEVSPVDGDTRSAESVDLFINSDVPAAWTSEFSETVDGRRIFIVAIDAEAFKARWGVDGVRFSGLDTTVDFLPLMDETDAARECTLLVEEDYDDGLYVGKLRRYEGCGEGTEAVVIGANDIDGEGTVLVELQMVELDEAVVTMITESFVV